MRAPYPKAATLRSPLLSVAATLMEARSRPCRLAPLILMSDPDRTPDITALAERMPRGSALIYRHFGADEHLKTAKRLRSICTARSIQFLIGADPDLAQAVGADGVHFPRTTPPETILYWRARKPDWIITQAAPKDGGINRNLDALDALFVSSIFNSNSPSAGTPIGLAGLKKAVAALNIPIIALGGMTKMNAATLIGSGAAGLAAIDGLAHYLRGNDMSDKTQGIDAKPVSQVSIHREETDYGYIFIAAVAGETAKGELTLKKVRGGVFNANHTGVPREIGGRGVGKKLVKALSEDARANGYKVIPGCPFIAKLWDRIPSLAEGVAA